MRAGPLNKLIIIKEEIKTTNEYGAVELSYNIIKTTRASINPVSGKESNFLVGKQNLLAKNTSERSIFEYAKLAKTKDSTLVFYSLRVRITSPQEGGR